MRSAASNYTGTSQAAAYRLPHMGYFPYHGSAFGARVCRQQQHLVWPTNVPALLS